MLNLCYAQLELDYGYLRAVTPFYSVYDITIRGNADRQKVLNDDTYYAKLIRQYWSPKGVDSYHVSIQPREKIFLPVLLIFTLD